MKKIIYILLIAVIGLPLYLISGKESDSFKDFINQDSVVDNEQSSNILEDSEDTFTQKTEEPVFSYSQIPDHIKDKMIGKSMPSNEPIDFNNLSYLTLTYYGFDGKTHIGEMIVDARVGAEVVDIFKELYSAKYEIEKIRLIDEYDALDEVSMADNNSSAFCYRTIAGTNKISNHGMGLAIDINPLQNPHVIGNTTSPKEGYVYANRNNTSMGMIQKGDAAYTAFTKRGWTWGGYWTNPDYQHFEKQL